MTYPALKYLHVIGAIVIEPLGALVKTGPAIVLMLVGLAMLEER